VAWGCTHERAGKMEYGNTAKLTHASFSIADSGLHINPLYPHIGASPDGLVNCHCCGFGIVEIKCPYCSKDKGISADISCLKANPLGGFSLDRNHAYYYQVQTQLHVCDATYCDFVVWTSSEFHCERILPDDGFWSDVLQKSTLFFKEAILPELTAKWFTQPRPT
jgi:hypothetical protein